MMNTFLAGADRIVATSPNYVETSPILQRYRDKIAVIPLGLSRDHYPTVDPAAREAWRARFGARFFLFVGAFRYYKGLDTLVAAARRVDAPVVIVGDGPLGPELRREADAKRIGNLHFVGALGDADKMALLELCRAFVFPSNRRSQAFGRALLEAAMMNKPIVSCEIGTGTSYINRDGETGYIVPPDDPAALACAMTRLARDAEAAAAMGAAARRRYESLFTAEAMAESYAALYRELVVQSPPLPT
jgi:rhamnosyl/mannosyltransferase